MLSNKIVKTYIYPHRIFDTSMMVLDVSVVCVAYLYVIRTTKTIVLLNTGVVLQSFIGNLSQLSQLQKYGNKPSYLLVLFLCLSSYVSLHNQPVKQPTISIKRSCCVVPLKPQCPRPEHAPQQYRNIIIRWVAIALYAFRLTKMDFELITIGVLKWKIENQQAALIYPLQYLNP